MHLFSCTERAWWPHWNTWLHCPRAAGFKRQWWACNIYREVWSLFFRDGFVGISNTKSALFTPSQVHQNSADSKRWPRASPTTGQWQKANPWRGLWGPSQFSMSRDLEHEKPTNIWSHCWKKGWTFLWHTMACVFLWTCKLSKFFIFFCDLLVVFSVSGCVHGIRLFFFVVCPPAWVSLRAYWKPKRVVGGSK